MLIFERASGVVERAVVEIRRVSVKDRRTVVAGRGALLCAALIGCHGRAFDSSADAGPGASHGGGSFGGSSADAAGPFSVTATASATSICAEQCDDLSAQAYGGVAPYTYAWGDAPPSAAIVGQSGRPGCGAGEARPHFADGLDS